MPAFLLHPVTLGVLVLILLLAVSFVAFYVVPSFKTGRQLRRALRALREIDAKTTPPDELLRRVKGVFETTRFSQSWQEFRETLHLQSEPVGGELRTTRVRATALAEVFFSTQAIVDTRLRAEFFKHLPGILTGIGIIGTFLGLINGLNHFDPTLPPEQVKFSLDSLLKGVLEAFYASAVAIFTAMLITFIEKFHLSRRYAEVEELTQALDSMFEAGAGEEYLSRLVQASEESSAQTRQLKDSLIEDLKSLMTNLAERQIQSYQAASLQVATHVSDSIRDSLQGPLDQIAAVVDRASGTQSHAVQGMMENLLSAFLEKMDATFGNQMTGLASMMNGSVDALQNMQRGFAELVAQMEQSGKSSSEAMSEKFAQMLADADERQKAMQQQMSQFLLEMREVASSSQQQSSAQLAEAMGGVHKQLTTMFEDFAERRNAAAEMERLHQQRMLTKTTEMFSGLNQNVEGLMHASSEASSSMKENIAVLSSTATGAIGQMNEGAREFNRAAERFAQTSGEMTRAMAGAELLYTKLTAASQTVAEASDSLKEVVSDHRQHRAVQAQLVQTLQQLVESAKEEAGVSKRLISELSEVATRMQQVSTESKEYLDNVSEVLTTAFDNFQELVNKKVQMSSAEFHKNLDQAVKMLASTIDELSSIMPTTEVVRRA